MQILLPILLVRWGHETVSIVTRATIHQDEWDWEGLLQATPRFSQTGFLVEKGLHLAEREEGAAFSRERCNELTFCLGIARESSMAGPGFAVRPIIFAYQPLSSNVDRLHRFQVFL